MSGDLQLSADEVLSTTRAVRRRLELDRPVERDVLESCLRLAMQAPSGSNRHRSRFVVVTDDEKRAAIAEVYREAFEAYRTSGRFPTDEATEDRRRRATQERVASSAAYLAEVMHRVPVHVVPCIQGRPPSGDDLGALSGFFGSVLPAVWSFMLAARNRGLGTCWTTMHLSYEQRVAELLELPTDVTQVALIPTAYTLGTDFRPASRPPLDAFAAWDRWHAP